MADTIKIGSLDISAFKVGSSDCKIYLGSTLLYPTATPAPKWIATYSDTHIESAQCNSSSSISNNEITKTDLVDIVIGDCVTGISFFAFSGATSLENVTFGNSIASLNISAFQNCESLTSIDLPDSVTTIGANTFRDCINLTTVNIGTGITTIDGSSFQSCSSLTSVTINATTPPTLGSMAFESTNNCPIFVPAASLSAYQTAWSTYASRIQAIPVPTPTYQWVLYNEGDTVPSTTFYGVKLYGLELNGEIDFSVDGHTGVAFIYDYANSEWTALDMASYDPIDISGYFDGDNCYTILFSDIGYGGMSVEHPAVGEQFEFDVDLYEEHVPTLQWVTFNNGDTISSDLDVYGVSGISQDLLDTYGSSGSYIQFARSKIYIEFYIYNSDLSYCSDGSRLATDQMEIIFSNRGCSDFINQGARVSGTIQLYIYA